MQTNLVTTQSPLLGSLKVPGDKSVAHRALILAAMAEGESRLVGVPDNEDLQATIRCLRMLGATIERDADDTIVKSPGRPFWTVPVSDLDCGESGTTMRLLAGALAACPFTVRLTGAAGLLRRPMKRIAQPLSAMGARVLLTPDDTAPIEIEGGGLQPIEWNSPVASAQVKSAILLAGLAANGKTRVSEPGLSRDHTERLLLHLGAEVELREFHVEVRGPWNPPAFQAEIPGDLSSAAFLIAAAVVTPGSRVTVENVGVNPTRVGFLSALRSMGAKIASGPVRSSGKEPMADLTAEYSPDLRGVKISGAESLAALDELPLLAVVGAFAHGELEVRDAHELRVKESDRIETIVRALKILGVEAEAKEDGLVVAGGTVRGGLVDAGGDHRIAMSMAVAGCAAQEPVVIRGTEKVAKSFPEFFDCLTQLGAKIERA